MSSTTKSSHATPHLSIASGGKYDDQLRSVHEAIDFFRKRDRSRIVDMNEAVGARSLAWNCEGTTLGVGCQNRAVYVGSLDERSCRVRNLYVGYTDGQIEDLEFSPTNPRIFATCSQDRTVRIWDTNVSKTHTRIDTKDANLYLTWSPDDAYILTVGKTRNTYTVNAIDARSNEIHYSAVFNEEIFEPVFHPNGKFLFLTAENGRLIILEFPSMKRYRTIQAHPPLSECRSIAISPDGRTLAIGASDACCSIWNIEDMLCTRLIIRPDYPVNTVSFSLCSNLLALGSEDNSIDVSWVHEPNDRIAEVPILSQCYDLAWNPRYYLLAYATAVRESERNPITVQVFGCPGESRKG